MTRKIGYMDAQVVIDINIEIFMRGYTNDNYLVAHPAERFERGNKIVL